MTNAEQPTTQSGGVHYGQNNKIKITGDVIGGDKITWIINGQTLALPNRAELLAYLRSVQQTYARWADQPARPEPPLIQLGDDSPSTPDAYIDTRALPMRVAAYRLHAGDAAAPAQELVAALGNATHTVILGEPGSGKTTALERLAWVTATTTLAGLAAQTPATPNTDDDDSVLVLPIFARLADYAGQPDLLTLLRQALNGSGVLALDEDNLVVRRLLRAQNIRWVLLLDGLNEFSRAYQEQGQRALRGHLADYPQHVVHVTCRMADFDKENQAPRTAQLWTVQPLSDTLRYWDDPQGESDVRDYLRRHLGAADGKRLWERIHADARLRELACFPLFLFMLKQAAAAEFVSAQRALPPDRGQLVHSFVHAERVLGRVPRPLRERAARSLEQLGWWLQTNGTRHLELDVLYAQLESARGPARYDVDVMRQQLQMCGLLLDLGQERYALVHQLVQEYAAAAYLVRQPDYATHLPALTQQEWWRETVIMALWLHEALRTPAYLQHLMGDAEVDLRVRVAAANVLAQVGDPRFEPHPQPHPRPLSKLERGALPLEVIEPQMVRIAAGEARLGGEDPDAYDDELPSCTVPIAAFELAIYPVTNAEYACFIQAGGYADESLWTPAGRAWLHGEGKLDAETEKLYRDLHQGVCADVEGWIANAKRTESMTDEDADFWREIATSWTEDEFVDAYSRGIYSEQRREPYYWQDSRFNGKNQPVVGVNWYEALAYAAWLAQVTGQPYRLPSEAEWEWAAGRRTAADGRRYPWGDAWDAARCNSRESRLDQPSPVGIYPHGATPDGLFDLAGNVYEWTATLYRPYPYQPDDGREDLLADGLRVMRGGSWYVGRDRVRCAYRSWNDPRFWCNYLGLRLARNLS